MKSSKNQFPKFLACLPEIDFFQPGEDPADGGGGVASPFDATDFQLYSSAAAGATFDYTEMHLNSPAGGGTVPIKSQDDPERAMFIGGLPPVGADWSMSIVFTQGAFSDTLTLSRIAGKFETVRLDILSRFTILFEEPGVFFTVETEAGRSYQTYVNVNIATETALVEHHSSTTFDLFGLSMLGRSN